MRSFTSGLILIGVSFFGAQAQTAPASDPQALALAAQSIAAIAGKSNITDVTLTGNATWNKQESGTFKLSALGNGESRIDLASSSGATTVIRDAQTGVSVGGWNAPNRAGSFAFHNCLTDAAWFFPSLGSLSATPNVVLTYVGKESRNGIAVQHLQSHVYQTGRAFIPMLQQLSTMDFYLDASSLLPVATTFNAHPDNDALTNVLIEVDFSGYQPMSGIMVPTHIQRYQQGSLMLDLAVAGASFNSRLPLSLFAVK